MPNRIKSIFLVALQFLFIFLLLLGSPLTNISLVGYAFFSLSIFLVLWAIVTMKKSKLRILPQPSANATLVTNGPYRFIRHPMYTAILLGSVGLMFHHFTLLRLAMLIALTIVLRIKLNWEEKMLAQKFDGYKQYTIHTYRLIPFVF